MVSPAYLLLLLLTILSTSPSFSFSLTSTNGTVDAASNISTDDANTDSIRPSITISQFVAAHNAARRLVGSPPLVWEPLLATYARVYANQRRHDCQLVHSPGYAFGENIFWGKGRRWSAADVVATWVAEKQWYHYDTNSCSGPDCSHYTQIVWRTTQRLGCAKIVCDSGDTWVGCEYYPPGNYVGARPYKQQPTP